MGTVRLKFFSFFTAILLLGLALLQGCQQQCQPTPTTPFLHLEDATWRAASTTNPSLTITKFDFIELQFSRDFTGKVIKVVQNQEYTNPPIETFTWAVPDDTQGSGLLRIQYSTPGSGTGADATPPQVIATDDYQFDLTTELDLTEQETGYTWRFVPMTGVVDPDSNCTF